MHRLYVRFASLGFVIAGVGLIELRLGKWHPGISLALVVFGLASLLLFGLLLWKERNENR